MISNWTFDEVDKRIAAEFEDFLPDDLFDAHAHLYQLKDLKKMGPVLTEGPEVAGVDVWRGNLGKMVGAERLKGGLFFGFPDADCDIEGANNFLIEQLEQAPQSRGLLLISPQTPVDKIKK